MFEINLLPWREQRRRRWHRFRNGGSGCGVDIVSRHVMIYITSRALNH